MGPLLEFAVRVENHWHPRDRTCACITDVTFSPWYTNVVGDPEICLLSEEPERPDFFGKGFVCPDYGQGDREFYSFADETSSEETSGAPDAEMDCASSSPDNAARDAAFEEEIFPTNDGSNPQS